MNCTMAACLLTRCGANKAIAGTALLESIFQKQPILHQQHATLFQGTVCLFNESTRRDIPAETVAAERAEKLSARVKSYDEIPGPKPFPIIGNAWRFMPFIGEYHGMELTAMHRQMYEKYGPIVSFKGFPGMFDMVLAYSPEDVEVVFRNEGPWPSRGSLQSLEYYRTVLRKDFYKGFGGVLVENGEKWLESRKKVNPAMMQPRVAKRYVIPIAGVAQDFIEKIKTLRDTNDEMPPDFMNELFKWSLESIAYVTMDTRLGCLAPNLAADSEPQKMINAVGDFFECLFFLEIGPPMWKIYPTKTWKKYVKALDIFLDVSQKHVNKAIERFNTQKQKGGEESEPSVLERLLAQSDPTTATIMAQDMISAGIDTTSYSVAMVIYALSKNQDKQEILFEELKRHLPNKDDPITEEMLEDMKYLKACLKETLRVYPIGSGNVRFSSKEIVLSNYKIPPGIGVVMPTIITNSSDEVFPQSHRFIPERWLKSRPTEETVGCAEDFDLASKTKRNPFAFIPFGFGPRSCVGRRFAEMEVETVMAKMVRNFKIEYNYGEMKFVSKILNMPKDPLRFKLTDRV